jgi:tRNA (uracil-5-)-methyltransferase
VPENIDKYRNKVEFTVGRTYKPPTEEGRLWDEGDICVGFNRGNAFKGIVFVERPDAIRVNSDESLAVAKIFEEIVKESGVGPYEKNSNSGFWRILVVRESKTTKQMLVSVVVTKGHEMAESVRNELVAKLGTGTKVGSFEIVSLTLIKSQDLSGGYKEHDEMEVLSGKDSYEELLCGLKFNVSPCAFF